VIYDINDIPEHLRRYFKPAPEVGLEPTPEEYVAKLVEVFREVRRVLKPNGTLWIVIGDTYATKRPGNKVPRSERPWSSTFHQASAERVASRDLRGDTLAPGLKPKDLVGVPWMLALALRADGWYLRSCIIWHKTFGFPESVTDRPTVNYEYIFLLSKAPRYFYDAEAIQGSEGANKRAVWAIAPATYDGAHFAVFPEELAATCIRAGSAKKDLVLDPFSGSGTTLSVALELGRDYLGIELNEAFGVLIDERLERARSVRHQRDLFDLAMENE
jgi:site-specific DNA-methyltransferase (cytosine-N4-specific)